MDIRLLGFAGLTESANLHPAVVHFPVAIVPVSFLLLGGGYWSGNRGVRLAGRACLWLGVVSAMVAVFTGARAVNDMPRDAAAWAILHAHWTMAVVFTSLTTALAALSGTGWELGRRGAWAFLLALALDCAVCLETGDLGARMVYGHGAAVEAPPARGRR